MYAGNADKITIETDDRGFELHVLTDDEGYFSFNVQAIAEELYDTVKREIGPWLYERDMAHAEFKAGIHRTHPAFACDPDESGGYDVSDPKRPEFHSVHVDLYDNREKV